MFSACLPTMQRHPDDVVKLFDDTCMTGNVCRHLLSLWMSFDCRPTAEQRRYAVGRRSRSVQRHPSGQKMSADFFFRTGVAQQLDDVFQLSSNSSMMSFNNTTTSITTQKCLQTFACCRGCRREQKMRREKMSLRAKIVCCAPFSNFKGIYPPPLYQ